MNGSLENRNKQIEKLEKLKDKLYIFTEHNKRTLQYCFEHANTNIEHAQNTKIVTWIQYSKRIF